MLNMYQTKSFDLPQPPNYQIPSSILYPVHMILLVSCRLNKNSPLAVNGDGGGIYGVYLQVSIIHIIQA